MFIILKKLARLLFPLHQRLNIFWRWEILHYLFKTPGLKLRNSAEQELANDFQDNFFSLNRSEQQGLTTKLKTNLDENSQQEIDNFIDRQQYIFSHDLLQTKKLFSQSEKKEQEECASIIKKMRRQFSRFKLKQFAPEIFYGQSGLRWLPEESKKRLMGGHFIDVGAYDGDSALMLNHVFQAKKIWAFEPEEENYRALKNNAKILGDEVIEVIQAGASDHSGTGELEAHDSASKLQTNGQQKNIKIITLDEFFGNQTDNTKIDLIKMDIEGSESLALKGARQVIATWRPILAISIYHNTHDFFHIKEQLGQYNPRYRFMIKKAHPFELTRETMLIAY